VFTRRPKSLPVACFRRANEGLARNGPLRGGQWPSSSRSRRSCGIRNAGGADTWPTSCILRVNVWRQLLQFPDSKRRGSGISVGCGRGVACTARWPLRGKLRHLTRSRQDRAEPERALHYLNRLRRLSARHSGFFLEFPRDPPRSASPIPGGLPNPTMRDPHFCRKSKSPIKRSTDREHTPISMERFIHPTQQGLPGGTGFVPTFIPTM